jgi:hypothetical protein
VNTQSRKRHPRKPVVPWQQSPPASPTVGQVESAQRPVSTVVMNLGVLDCEAIEAASPAALRAFRKFERSWSRNQGTRGDFFNIVRLLQRAGCARQAEMFLRANLWVSAEEGWSRWVDDAALDLYVELFGTARREEFAAAIAAFATQFAAPLTRGAGGGFFVGYHTVPRSACFAQYRMQNEPCYVRFEYDHPINLDAWLESQTSEDQIVVLRWASGVWEIIGKGILTQVYDGGGAEPRAAPDRGRI